jgi:cytoskeletal protein CcmA (bactofilin family)
MKVKSSEISIIDRGLTIDGSVSSKGKLIIKGTVKGKITGETVVIAEEGAVYADTSVVDMTVGGQFEGALQASGELVILKTGNCTGKVVCKDLVVEAGGRLNADITRIIKDKNAAPQKGPVPIKP